jgi:hypothetical protein
MANRKNNQLRAAGAAPRPRRKLVLMSCVLIATGTLAQWRLLRVSPAVNPATTAVTTPAAPDNSSLAAANPAKEYIYAGGRLLATEEPAATPTPTPTPTPCSLPASINLIISEFRLRGPLGAADEFIELYNNSDAPLTVCSSDGSPGWAVVSADGLSRFVINNGTVIAPRAHYLGANSGGGVDGSSYSLGGYAAPDSDFTDMTTPPPPPPGDFDSLASLPGGENTDIADNTGLALFNTSNLNNWTLANRLDAVGFNSTTNSLYREGTGLTPITAIDGEHSFVRKAVAATGAPQDTGNNTADFLLISTDAGAYGRGGAIGDPVNGPSILGAPGPEGLTSPVPRFITPALIDPNVSASSAPNREVCGTTSCKGTNAAAGTMIIRRKFTNQTGLIIKRLRFRVIDITTLNSPGYSPGGTQADLRELVSTDTSDTSVLLSNGTSVPVKRTTVEGPNQPLGGGLSTSLLVTLPTTGLPAGESVNVQFVLGVQKGGSFRFTVLMEAIP